MTEPRDASLGPRSRLVAASATLLLVTTTAWVLLTRGDVSIDLALHRWLGTHPNATLHFLATWAKQPGTRIVYLTTVGAAAAAGWACRRSLRPLLIAGALVGTETLLLFLFKVAVGRRSPRSGLVAIHTAGTSFPGGHAANAVLGAGLAGWWIMLAAIARTGSDPDSREARNRALRCSTLAATVVGALAGVAMTWLDYHWLTDTLAGWAIGTLALMAGISLDDRFGRRTVHRQTAAPSRSKPARSNMSDSK